MLACTRHAPTNRHAPAPPQTGLRRRIYKPGCASTATNQPAPLHPQTGMCQGTHKPGCAGAPTNRHAPGTPPPSPHLVLQKLVLGLDLLCPVQLGLPDLQLSVLCTHQAETGLPTGRRRRVREGAAGLEGRARRAPLAPVAAAGRWLWGHHAALRLRLEVRYVCVSGKRDWMPPPPPTPTRAPAGRRQASPIPPPPPAWHHTLLSSIRRWFSFLTCFTSASSRTTCSLKPGPCGAAGQRTAASLSGTHNRRRAGWRRAPRVASTPEAPGLHQPPASGSNLPLGLADLLAERSDLILELFVGLLRICELAVQGLVRLGQLLALLGRGRRLPAQGKETPRV